MEWTTKDIRYLEEHQSDGAAAIAEALGRTVISVQVQASRHGIPLTPRWQCPKCGATTRSPLNPATGWCANCTKEARRERLEKEVREMEEEVMRAERENRARQALYSKKSRVKKKLKSMKNDENRS